jgi:sugar lactone lactonase YvrE
MNKLLHSILIPCSFFYPEGPIIQDNGISLTQYSKNNIVTVAQNSKTPKVFWEEDKCGPASQIKLKAMGQTLVSCYDKNEVVLIDPEGKTLNRYTHPKLEGPNDFALIDDHTVLVSASGVFDPKAPVTGKIFLLKNGKFQVLTEDIHYPNGLAYIPELKKVIVSEHLANRLLSFDFDGKRLTNKKIFYELPRTNKDLFLGPDGLKKRDSKNSLLMAQYGGGQILEVDFSGKLVKTYPLKDKYPTNLALQNDQEMFVTIMKDAANPPYNGRIDVIKLD